MLNIAEFTIYVQKYEVQNLHSADVERVAFGIHKESPVVECAAGEFSHMI